MNYTPGPWKIAGEDRCFVYATAKNGTNSFWAHVQTAGSQRIDEVERAANARLIAAAPELAKFVEDWLRDFTAAGPTDSPREAEARALLARIKGEA